MKTLTVFLAMLLSSATFAVDEPGIRTVGEREANEVRRQMIESGVRVIGTVIDNGQAHIITASGAKTGRFGLQPLGASEFTWIRDAWQMSASLDYSHVYSIDERPPTLEQRWQAVQSVIDLAKANGRPTAEAEALLAHAKQWMTEESAIAAINAATDADAGLTQQRVTTAVTARSATGLYYDFEGNLATVPDPVMGVADLDDIALKQDKLTFNYWVGRVHIAVALVDGGDSTKYHLTPGQVERYKRQIVIGLSYLSRVAATRNIPQDWVVEFVSNNPSGTVRVQQTPVKRSSGKQFSGSSNVTDWVSWVAASQGYAEGGTAAYRRWVNDNRRANWANHAAVMLVPFTAGYDKFGLGLGDDIWWANYQDYPGGWDVDGDNDRDVSGYYSVVGTGSDSSLFPLAFCHELLHQPNACDLAWYACTTVPGCEKRCGEIRRVNNNCEECSGAPQDSSLMNASRMNWDLDESTLAMIGWTVNDNDYQPNCVDPNCINYWLYHRDGVNFGTAMTFAVLDLGNFKFLETVIATEYSAVLSPFTGQVNVAYDASNEARVCIVNGSTLYTVLNWDLNTFDEAPSLLVFNQTSPSIQVETGVNGVRVGLLNFLGNLSVEIIGGPSLMNGCVFLGHPTTRTWYEFDIPVSLLPGTKQVRVKGAFAHWDGTWQLPTVIGPLGFNMQIGDLNLNFESYEIGDAVLYSRYFIEGRAVFDPLFFDLHERVSEVNRDGIPLTVADLVYLIRVIVHDAPALAKVAPLAPAYVWTEGNELWLETPVELAGLAMTLTGISSDPDSLLPDCRFERKGDTSRFLSIDQDQLRTVVPAGRTLIARFHSSDELMIVVMSASTQDGWEMPLVASRIPVPYAYSLAQNYPNPFNSQTAISYSLPHDGYIELKIFNTLGQHVRMVEQGFRLAGDYSVVWDGQNENGKPAASGMYFYALSYDGARKDIKRMMLLK